MLLFFGYPVVKNVVMGFQDYTSETFFTGEAPVGGVGQLLDGASTRRCSARRLSTRSLFTVGVDRAASS